MKLPPRAGTSFLPVFFMGKRRKSNDEGVSGCEDGSPFDRSGCHCRSRIISISIRFSPRKFPASSKNISTSAIKPAFDEVRFIHGKGKGVQRNIIRALLAKHPDVIRFTTPRSKPAVGARRWSFLKVNCESTSLGRRTDHRPCALYQIEKRNGDSDGDETVGEVESRPVIVRPVDIEKIDHFAVE